PLEGRTVERQGHRAGEPEEKRMMSQRRELGDPFAEPLLGAELLKERAGFAAKHEGIAIAHVDTGRLEPAADLREVRLGEVAEDEIEGCGARVHAGKVATPAGQAPDAGRKGSSTRFSTSTASTWGT